MAYIFFTKLIKEMSIPQVVDALKQIGADGADLCVRDGYPVNPKNCRDTLPKAAATLRSAGLDIPLVTAPTSLTDPNMPEAEPLFRACHDARVGHIKLGYWEFKPGDYWAQIDKARKQLEGFADLAMRFGVKACLHTHSGMNLGLNASSAMHMARGFSPSNVGIYLDTGHMSLYGEPPEMAVSIAGEHLCLVGIKDSEWIKGENGKPRRSQFAPPGHGSADWNAWGKALKSSGFHGHLSFHSEYEVANIAERLAQTKKDIEFVKRTFGA